MTATSEPGHADDWADTGPIPLPPATEDADKAREARPQLHTLYRFWTVAADGEDVDQEWDGWWSGRNWHALYDMGIWDPEFVARWEPLADAEVEAATRELRAEVERLRGEVREWEDWSNELAMLLPEDAETWPGVNPEGAQESIITACLTHLLGEAERLEMVCDAAASFAVARREAVERAMAAEAERDQLRAVAEGRILHRFMGNCPDSLDGFDLRDPDCPACAALVQVGAT